MDEIKEIDEIVETPSVHPSDDDILYDIELTNEVLYMLEMI